MHAPAIDALSSDLLHRLQPAEPRNPFSFLPTISGRPEKMPVSLPLVFNQMLHPSQTEDGLHFSDLVVGTQAQVLLNMQCNDVLPRTFGMLAGASLASRQILETVHL